MNAAGVRKRVARLQALLAGLDKETAAVLADRGDLTPQEWNRYVTAVLNAKDGLHEARRTLAIALDRLDAEAKREGR